MTNWKSRSIIRGYLLVGAFLTIGIISTNIYVSWFEVLVALYFFVMTTREIVVNES